MSATAATDLGELVNVVMSVHKDSSATSKTSEVVQSSSASPTPVELVTGSSPPQRLECRIRVDPQLFTALGVGELLLNVSAANGDGTIDEVFKPEPAEDRHESRVTWRFTPSQLEISRFFEFSSSVKDGHDVGEAYQISGGLTKAVWLTAYVGPVRVPIKQPIHLLGCKQQSAARSSHGTGSKRRRNGSLTPASSTVMGGSSTEEVGAGGSYPVISNVAESESTLNHCVMEKMTDEVASPHGFLQPSRVIGTPPAGCEQCSSTSGGATSQRLLPRDLRSRCQLRVPQPNFMVFNVDRNQSLPVADFNTAKELKVWMLNGSSDDAVPKDVSAEGPPLVSGFVELRVEGIITTRIPGSFCLGLDVVSEENKVRASFVFPAFHMGGPCDDFAEVEDYMFSDILPASSFQPGDRLCFKMYEKPAHIGEPEKLLTDFGTPTASIRLLIH